MEDSEIVSTAVSDWSDVVDSASREEVTMSAGLSVTMLLLIIGMDEISKLLETSDW